MPKGGKKRRAIRKKKDKGLHSQTSGTTGKDESHTCQQPEEDSCSPKTPVQTSEGDEKEAGSPTSQAEGFAVSQGIEHTNGSLENLEFHNFSDSQTDGIGNLDELVRTSDRHGTFQPPQKQEKPDKDAFLDLSAVDVVKISNNPKMDLGSKVETLGRVGTLLMETYKTWGSMDCMDPKQMRLHIQKDQKDYPQSTSPPQILTRAFLRAHLRYQWHFWTVLIS